MEVKGLTPQHKSKYRFRLNSFLPANFTLLQNYISLLAFASGEDKSGKKKMKIEKNKKRGMEALKVTLSFNYINKGPLFLDL